MEKPALNVCNIAQYDTMQIYIASKVASESKAPLDSEGCLYVLQATENKVVFK